MTINVPISDECLKRLNYMRKEGENIEDVLERAIDEAAPTEADIRLAKMVAAADRCQNCGEKLDQGAWCDLQCMREWGQEVKEDEDNG